MGHILLLPVFVVIVALILVELKDKSLWFPISWRGMIRVLLLYTPASSAIRKNADMLDVATIWRFPLDADPTNADTWLTPAVESIAVGANTEDSSFGQIWLVKARGGVEIWGTIWRRWL